MSERALAYIASLKAAYEAMERERDEAESSWVLQVASLERRAEAAEWAMVKHREMREAAEARIQELEAALREIQGAAGHPDAAQACRNILAIARRALEQWRS